MQSNVKSKLIDYNLNILSKLIPEKDFNKIDRKSIYYANNKSGLIKIISCSFYDGSTIIYILKSSINSIANYRIINTIQLKNKGTVVTGLSLLTNSKKSWKNVLGISVYYNNIATLFLYTKIFNKDVLVTKMTVNDCINLEDVVPNMLILHKNKIILNYKKDECMFFTFLSSYHELTIYLPTIADRQKYTVIDTRILK